MRLVESILQNSFLLKHSFSYFSSFQFTGFAKYFFQLRLIIKKTNRCIGALTFLLSDLHNSADTSTRSPHRFSPSVVPASPYNIVPARRELQTSLPHTNHRSPQSSGSWCVWLLHFACTKTLVVLVLHHLLAWNVGSSPDWEGEVPRIGGTRSSQKAAVYTPFHQQPLSLNPTDCGPEPPVTKAHLYVVYLH